MAEKARQNFNPSPKLDGSGAKSRCEYLSQEGFAVGFGERFCRVVLPFDNWYQEPKDCFH